MTDLAVTTALAHRPPVRYPVRDGSRRPAPEPPREPSVGYLYVAVVAAVLCTVSWRRGVYFTGGLDTVVAAKGALGAVALLLSVYCWRRGPARAELGVRTIGFAAAYLLATCLGGWQLGTLVPSMIVAVRVAMLLAALAFLLVAFGARRLVTALIGTLLAVAAVSIATGVGSAREGRLSGGLPPLLHNELAFMCAGGVLLVVHRALESKASRWEVSGAAVLLGTVWLTGSRTGAAALAVAVLVMVVQARRFSVPAFIAMVAAVPAAAFVLLTTSVVSGMFLRGGSENVMTLSSRTIAWRAAFDMDVSAWQRWFGGGLTMKHIPVSGQYWDTQLLDSSWVSTLVQGGRIGLALSVLWFLTTVVAACRTPRPWRLLWLGALTLVGIRSILESGVFDASPSFLVFALVGLATEGSLRTRSTSGAVPRQVGRRRPPGARPRPSQGRTRPSARGASGGRAVVRGQSRDIQRTDLAPPLRQGAEEEQQVEREEDRVRDPEQVRPSDQ